MSIMLEELHAASGLLDLATTRHLQACSAVQKSCIAGGAKMLFPPELLITRLGDEVNAYNNYMIRLQDAGIAISSAQNYSKRASASALPPEILTHIFRYVLAGSKCEGFRDLSRQSCLQETPEQLSHVCSSWRWAAINSSGLWVHIDLSINSRLTLRTKRYIARSSQLPLYIHIWGSFGTIGHGKDESHTPFIASLAPRTKSVYLDPYDGDYEGSTLKAFLENCTPGILNHITMRPFHDKTLQFILARDQEMPEILRGSDTLRLDVSKQHFESIMLGLTILQSGRPYPLWDSKAYHNLTDLCMGGVGEIPESQLVAILRSSAQLAPFEIALMITDCLPITSPVELIYLVNLEKLKTRGRSPISSLLRWIAPGSKPLQLILTSEIFYHTFLTSSLKEQLQKFFLRSNTTRALVDMKDHYSMLVDFFSTTSSIKELVINSKYTSMDFTGSLPVPKLPLRLDTLYLLQCHIEVDFFLNFIEPLAVQNIVLWSCIIQKSERIFEDELSKLHPAARVLSHETPNPVEDW